MKRLPLFLLPLLLATGPVRAQSADRAEPSPAPQGTDALPPAPDTGTPKGNSIPGMTRPATSCRFSERPLAALVSGRGEDYTTSRQPTFYFYIPYGRDDIDQLRFVLLDGRERNTLHRETVEVAATVPGIVKVTLPAAVPLEPGQLYRWYLTLDCHPDTIEGPDLMVNGWVRHQAAIADDVAGPSYDAIAEAMERILAAPSSAARQQWNALVFALGLSEELQDAIVEIETADVPPH